jgi:hypothetical protein
LRRAVVLKGPPDVPVACETLIKGTAMDENKDFVSEPTTEEIKIVDEGDKLCAAVQRAAIAVVTTVRDEGRVCASIYRADITFSQRWVMQDGRYRRMWDGRCEIAGVFSPVSAVAGLVADYVTDLYSSGVDAWTGLTESIMEDWKASESDDRDDRLGFDLHQFMHTDERALFPKTWAGREAAVDEAAKLLSNYEQTLDTIAWVLLKCGEIDADQVADLVALQPRE